MPAASPAQRMYYSTFLVPMWRGQLDELAIACRNYRINLLAVGCLMAAKGPGADPLALAEFCRRWTIPLTAPALGPTAWLRRFSKIAVGGPSAGSLFDPTGALNWGTKILANSAPLIAAIQMEGAKLLALNTQYVSVQDQSAVLSTLANAATPHNLTVQLGRAKQNLERVYDEINKLAEKMEAARMDLGFPEGSL